MSGLVEVEMSSFGVCSFGVERANGTGGGDADIEPARSLRPPSIPPRPAPRRSPGPFGLAMGMSRDEVETVSETASHHADYHEHAHHLLGADHLIGCIPATPDVASDRSKDGRAQQLTAWTTTQEDGRSDPATTADGCESTWLAGSYQSGRQFCCSSRSSSRLTRMRVS